jgi:mono/diheme cytochrome c family protein
MTSSRGIALGFCCLLVVQANGQGKARTTWDGVYSNAQAELGAAAYSQYCASCHGTDLAGGEMAPGLTNGEFQANWNTLPLDQLFERIRKTMPLDRPQTLNAAETSNIVAYILAKTGFPVGAAALPGTADELTAIEYSATKP